MGGGSSKASVILEAQVSALAKRLDDSLRNNERLEARVRELERVASGANVNTSDPQPEMVKTKQHWVEEKCRREPFFRRVWGSVDQELAPMVAVPLGAFVRHGRIPRSDDGLALPFLSLPSGARVIFVSHRWLRPHADPSMAHPDDADRSKHGLLCGGAAALADAKSWDEGLVYLWVDFACIHQDDLERKLAGISSLRGYAAACDELLVPCPSVPAGEPNVNFLPGDYGVRAWTRLEALTYFAVGALGEAGTHQIHAVASNEPLWLRTYRYHFAEDFRPSAGVLFAEDDRPVISAHEAEVLSFLEDGLGSPDMLLVFIRRGMLQGLRLGDAGAASLAELLRMERGPDGRWIPGAGAALASTVPLKGQGIGAAGAKALAGALQPLEGPEGRHVFNGAMEKLDLSGNEIGDTGAVAIAQALCPLQGAGGTWGVDGVWAGGVGRGALAQLHLSGNCIGEIGAAALGRALALRKEPCGKWTYNGAWEELCLANNAIGSKGAKALAEGLKPQRNPGGRWQYNKTLKRLDLSGDASIGDDGWTAIAEALQPRLNADGTCSQGGLDMMDVLGPWSGPNKAKAIARFLLTPSQTESGVWVHKPGALASAALVDDAIGDEGYLAVAEALQPRVNPDGSLAHAAVDAMQLLSSWEGDAKAIAVAKYFLAPRRCPSGRWVYNSALANVYIRGDKLGDEGVSAIAEALRPQEMPDGSLVSNQSLTSLNLSGKMVGDKGIRALADAMQPFTNSVGHWEFPGAITSLQIGNNCGQEGLEPIVKVLRPRMNPDDSIAHSTVNLSNFLNGWRGEGALIATASYLLAPLRTRGGDWVYSNRINSLSYQQAGVGQEGAVALGEALKPRDNPDGKWVLNTSVERVDLIGNRIDCQGAAAIACILQPQRNMGSNWAFNAVLRELTLLGNRIGDQGAAAIADAIAPRELKDGVWVFAGALEHLDLSENQIGPIGAAALSESISPRQDGSGEWCYNTKLRRLGLANNKLGPEGAQRVACSMHPRKTPAGRWTFNRTLVSLPLNGNNIGAEASKQCALAMLPYRNDDGTWVYNTALAEILYEGPDADALKKTVGRARLAAQRFNECNRQGGSKAEQMGNDLRTIMSQLKDDFGVDGGVSF